MASGPSDIRWTGGLQQVHCGPKVETLFVIVGGVGTIAPENWITQDGELWLNSIDVSSAPDVGILSFPNRLGTGGVLSWRDVEEQGAALLFELQRLTDDDTRSDCPIALFAHSLGGLIIKRAYCLAKQRASYYRSLLRRISCFILLGCPHSPSQSHQSWYRVGDLLQKFAKVKKNPIDASCIAGLAADCNSFQVFIEEDQKAVLTAYETKRLSKHALGRKIIFVDSDFAVIGYANELVLRMESNHRDLCIFQRGSRETAQVFDLLDSSLTKTRKEIKRGSPQYKPPIDMESTVRAESVIGDTMPGAIGQPIEDTRSPDVDLSFLDTHPPQSSQKYSETKDATAGSSEGGFELVAALKEFSMDNQDPVLPCKHIPLPRDDTFSGREDVLARIRQSFLPSEEEKSLATDPDVPSLSVFTLCGPGGMGKTSIANEFVYRYEKEFDAVFWITADESSKITESLAAISIELGLVSAVDSHDVSAVREALLGWLSNPLKSYRQLDHVKPERASWLIVFDNVDQAEVLDNFWPRESAGCVLVTCRDPLVKKFIYLRNFGIEVTELPGREGADLLLRLTDRQDDEEDVKDAATIIRTLSGYPLAIAQMAGVIVARDLSFKEFLDLYSEESGRKELLELPEGQTSSLRRYNHTLGTVWALDNLQEGKSLLDVLSILDPDSIQESIIDRNPACMDWDGYPKNTFAYTKARAQLFSGSLVSRNRDVKTLRIHRLIQDTVRAQMEAKRYNEVYRRTLNMLACRWPTTFRGFGNVQTDWDKCDELWKHIIAMLKHSGRFDPTTTASDAAISRVEFVLDAAWYSVMSSHFAQSEKLFQFSKKLRNAIQLDVIPESEDGRRWTAQLQKLDITYHHHRGEFGLHTNNAIESVSNFSLCVKELRTSLTDEEKYTDSFFGVALNELGCAYLHNWNEDNAVRVFEESLGILQKLQGSTKQLVTMPQINLGFAYGLAGRFDEASAIFEAALKDRFAELGQDDVTSFVNGKLYLGWGNVLAAQGKLDDSFKLHIKCLEHYKLSVGKFHHRTGDGCVKLSDHFARGQEYSTALALLDQALKIYEEHGYHKPEAARAHFKKMNVLRAKGEMEAAEVEASAALRFYNEIVPHEERVTTAANLEDEDFDHQIMFWSR